MAHDPFTEPLPQKTTPYHLSDDRGLSEKQLRILDAMLSLQREQAVYERIKANPQSQTSC